MTTASVASAVVLLACGLSGAVCKSRGHFSGVGFDFSTGGYHDVAVIVSPELNRAECPQILDDVKVSSAPKFGFVRNGCHCMLEKNVSLDMH